jgi:hypothetical protein
MEKVRIVNESVAGLPIVNYHAAGMDAGSTEMWVTCTNRAKQTCQFMTACYTGNLDELVSHLQSEEVTDVAMESTGIYGDPLRAKLEAGRCKDKSNRDQSLTVQKARPQDRWQRQRLVTSVSFGRFVPQIAHRVRVLA